MDELSSFRLYLTKEMKGKKRVRSVRTIDLHIELLTRLSKFAPDLSIDQVNSFFLNLIDTGRKGTYVNDYIDTLHVYGRFKGIKDYEALTYFPEDKYEKATMSDKEIEAFLNLPPLSVTRFDTRKKQTYTYFFGEKRWKVKTMFWKCLAYTGARPGEIASLTVDTLDFGRQVFVVTGKTGTRIIPIPLPLLDELTDYVKSLTTNLLFPSERGGKTRQNGAINDVSWGYDFHQRLKRLNIKRKNLTPYSLRHSFITRMLDEGVNLYPLQNLVGHKQGSPITSTYYHLTTKALVKTISKDPLQRGKMTYNERYIVFRDNVRQLLSEYCLDHLEEAKFLEEIRKGV